MRTLVYFIDGPNGSGKDYFIDNLVNGLNGHPVKINVKVLRATDFFSNRVKSTESRKYIAYDTEESKTLSIFNGHMNILEQIAEYTRDGVDVVIINRSFLSTLAYNLYKSSQLVERQGYLTLFTIICAMYQKYFDLTFVNMQITTAELLKRQQLRFEYKAIDDRWADTLIKNFDNACKTLERSEFRICNKESGQYGDVLNEILEIKGGETTSDKVE